MQTANVMVALGGDTGNTVFKQGVTPPELALLQAIHGKDAVFDIDPTDDAEALDGDGNVVEGGAGRTEAQELKRLRFLYGGATNGENQRHVDLLFPGLGAKAPTSFSQLEAVDKAQYKAKERVSAEKKNTEASAKNDKAEQEKLSKVVSDPAKADAKGKDTLFGDK